MTKKITNIVIVGIKPVHEDRMVIKLSDGVTVVQGSTTPANIFPTIKSLVAVLVAEDWKVAGQINRMDRDDFIKKFHLINEVESVGYDGTEPPRVLKELDIVLKSLSDREDKKEGIENLATAMVQESIEDDNLLSNLIKEMYNRDIAWKPESQGYSKVTGKAWGAEFELRCTHAVGNWYVEGWVGVMNIRIFKNHSGVQIYLTTGSVDTFPTDRCDISLSVNDMGPMFDWFKSLAQRQALARKDK